MQTRIQFDQQNMYIDMQWWYDHQRSLWWW